MRRIRLLVSSFQRIAFGPYTGTELDHLPSFKKKISKDPGKIQFAAYEQGTQIDTGYIIHS